MNNQTKLNKVMQLLETTTEPRREDYKVNWNTTYSSLVTDAELDIAFKADSNEFLIASNKYYKDTQALRNLRDYLINQIELEYAETLIN